MAKAKPKPPPTSLPPIARIRSDNDSCYKRARGKDRSPAVAAIDPDRIRPARPARPPGARFGPNVSSSPPTPPRALAPSASAPPLPSQFGRQGALLALVRQCPWRSSWTGLGENRCWFTCHARLGPADRLGGRETSEAHCVLCVRRTILEKHPR